MTAGTSDTLNDHFDDIAKALGVIEERMTFIVDTDELGDAMCQAVELGHRVVALQARLGLQCTANNVAALHGQRTIGQYVASRTNSRAVDVNQLVKSAKWLRDYPILEAAYGVELTDAHVKQLRKLDTTYQTHEKLRGDQQFFVDTAASCSFTGFVTACEYWLVIIDPDGEEPKDQLDSARFRIGKGRGGRGELTGECDAATAADIRTAVEHEANKLRIADKGAGVERTDSQRRMAATADLIKRGFARPDGSYPVPLGNIVMSQDVAEWALETLSGDIEPSDTVPVHPTNVDGRCELIDGTPIHPFLAVRALGLIGTSAVIKPANLRRYILDAKSRVLDVSANARRFPEWMRTAAQIQTSGACGTHGCDNPYHWLETDHVQPVAHRGETRFDNAEPLCHPDNQAKGATPGQTAWRDRPPPPRRRPRRRSQPPDDDPDAF